MAQVVGYFQDNVRFEEGPFVIVAAGGWRIESARVTERPCNCTLPHTSIYRFRESLGIVPGKFNQQREAEGLCDFLNQKVRDKEIVYFDPHKTWVHPDFMEA